MDSNILICSHICGTAKFKYLAPVCFCLCGMKHNGTSRVVQATDGVDGIEAQQRTG